MRAENGFNVDAPYPMHEGNGYLNLILGGQGIILG